MNYPPENDHTQKINQEIGERVEQLRNSRNLKQGELADATHNHQSVISRYESGTTAIPYARLIELADFFNVSCDFLLRNEPTDNKLEILKKYIHLEYRTCPVDEHLQEYLVLHINKALINYLYQAAQANHIPNLPPKAQEAWFLEMKKEFNSSNYDEKDFVSFIPFPLGNISTDNSPNRWDQATLLEKSTDFFTNNFT